MSAQPTAKVTCPICKTVAFPNLADMEGLQQEFYKNEGEPTQQVVQYRYHVRCAVPLFWSIFWGMKSTLPEPFR
jgi:hypothetical protein